jgi:hypothetical protein
MTREALLASATKLLQPSKSAAAEYAQKSERLAAEMNRSMGARPDVDYMVAGNLAMMEDNHRNHARFIESLFYAYDPAVLVDTVLWVFRAYRSHGFQLTYWPAQLDTWVEVLRRELSPQSMEEVYPFYRWMIINQPAFVMLSDSALPAETPTSKH